jgi:hypothetical protein
VLDLNCAETPASPRSFRAAFVNLSSALQVNGPSPAIFHHQPNHRRREPGSAAPKDDSLPSFTCSLGFALGHDGRVQAGALTLRTDRG